MSDAQPEDEHRMPLLEHLRELRNRLVVSFVVVVVGMLGSALLIRPIYGFLTAPMRLLLTDAEPYPQMDELYLLLTSPIRSIFPPEFTDVTVEGTLAVHAPMEGVYVWLYTTVISGVLLASPILAYQVWGFVGPGLYKQERKYVIPLTFASTLLFLMGTSFAFLVLLPVAFPFFLTVLPAEAILSVQSYLSTLVRLLLAFGVCFQLPIAVFFVARMGLVDARDMVSSFRYAIVIIFVLAAIITPPDILTQTLLGVPMIILYILSIGVAWMFTTKVRDDA
ncbi:MAG: sec-independent protein translocase protein TatC [Myxococcota bacterium]|jgi:sec-independent protein translocase protein TatC